MVDTRHTIHGGGALGDSMTLTFDLSASGSIRTKGLPWSRPLCLSTMMLVAQVVFIVERGQTGIDTHTHTIANTTDYPTCR